MKTWFSAVLDKLVLVYGQLTGLLPLVSTMLVVLFTESLDVGMTVTLGWIELGILLDTLTSLLLECDSRVLTVNVRVLCVEFTATLNSVCSVLLLSTDVLAELGDALLEKLDVAVAFWSEELVGMTVVNVGIRVAEVAFTVAVVGSAMEKVELLSTNEELETRALELGETVAFVLNTVVKSCSISLVLTIPLELNTVVRFCDFKVDVTKLEFIKGVALVRLTSAADVTVLFPVTITVVRIVLDVKALVLSVKTELLEFNKLLSTAVKVLENVALVFKTVTKLLALGSKMVEGTTIVSLLGRTNEEVLVNCLVVLGTNVELTTNTVDKTVRGEEKRVL